MVRLIFPALEKATKIIFPDNLLQKTHSLRHADQMRQNAREGCAYRGETKHASRDHYFKRHDDAHSR